MLQNRDKLKYYLSFFKKELTDDLLSFWMPRCLDKEHGGYFNCFTNDGSRLVSKDKYAWSQGRFLWLFSRLAESADDMFGKEQKALFLTYAESGKKFLLQHVLADRKKLSCAFLMDETGKAKGVDGYEGYDLSILADCFVVMGFAAYARAAKDFEAWTFARNLGESVWVRYETGEYRSLPYPVPKGYLSHTKPMILTNVLCELYYAAETFEKEYSRLIKERLLFCHKEVFEVFADKEGYVREFVRTDGEADALMERHINPGHTLEDMWFQREAAEILNFDRYKEEISKIVKQTLQKGWDEEFGGFYHFVPLDGFEGINDAGALDTDGQKKLVKEDFGSKLWWVHSEALYSSLLSYFETKDEAFWDWFEKIFAYTFEVFPNPDRSIGEWIQIRTREGKPQEKVVALPVKDPYHIIRNMILLIELLEKNERKQV